MGSRKKNPGVTQRFEIEGVERFLRILAKWKRGVRNRVLRKAITKAGRPLRKAVKRAAPKETGALRGSISLVVRVTHKAKGGIVTGIIGPKKGYTRPDPKGKGKRGVRVPTRYAHLVERGSKMGQRPQPFLNPTIRAMMGTYKAIFTRELIAGMKQEVRRARA